jgi:hypothetical protein
MKRWAILIGRIGTMLLAIGLALFLVSLIPPIRGLTSSSMGTFPLNPETWEARDQGILTPQQRLNFTISTNGTLNVYLFEVSSLTIYSWINEHYPGSSTVPSNVTYFEEFLQANPESVVWQKEINNEKIEHEYIPTKVTNATVVASNPSLDSITVAYSASTVILIAPTGKTQILAQWTIPIGFVLALPWLINSLKMIIRRRSSKF